MNKIIKNMHNVKGESVQYVEVLVSSPLTIFVNPKKLMLECLP